MSLNTLSGVSAVDLTWVNLTEAYDLFDSYVGNLLQHIDYKEGDCLSFRFLNVNVFLVIWVPQFVLMNSLI